MINLTKVIERGDELKRYENIYNNLKDNLPDGALPDYKVVISDFLNQLPIRKKTLFVAYYLQGKNFKETGKNIRLSRERVRQLTSRIFDRFPGAVINNYIREYIISLKKEKKHFSDNKEGLEYVIRKEEKLNNKVLKLPIEVLGLSSRTYNALKDNHIKTIGALIEKKDKLILYRNFGQDSYDKIKEKLKDYGFKI
jgi:hypothetical protein